MGERSEREGVVGSNWREVWVNFFGDFLIGRREVRDMVIEGEVGRLSQGVINVVL